MRIGRHSPLLQEPDNRAPIINPACYMAGRTSILRIAGSPLLELFWSRLWVAGPPTESGAPTRPGCFIPAQQITAGQKRGAGRHLRLWGGFITSVQQQQENYYPVMWCWTTTVLQRNYFEYKDLVNKFYQKKNARCPTEVFTSRTIFDTFTVYIMNQCFKETSFILFKC